MRRKSVYNLFRINVMRHADMACFQYQQGILSRERLAAALAIFVTAVVQYHQDEYPPEALERGAPGIAECIKVANEALTPE